MSEKPKKSTEAVRRTIRNIAYADGLAGKQCEHPEDQEYVRSWRRGQERADAVKRDSLYD
jgi:hypothetical protein